MIATTFIQIAIGGLVLAAGFYMGLVLINYRCERRVQRLAREGRYKEAVDRLYSMIWIGTKRDELPAWERVIRYLDENGYGQEMLTEAKLRSVCRMHYGRNVRFSDGGQL